MPHDPEVADANTKPSFNDLFNIKEKKEENIEMNNEYHYDKTFLENKIKKLK